MIPLSAGKMSQKKWAGIGKRHDVRRASTASKKARAHEKGIRLQNEA